MYMRVSVSLVLCVQHIRTYKLIGQMVVVTGSYANLTRSVKTETYYVYATCADYVCTYILIPYVHTYGIVQLCVCVCVRMTDIVHWIME